MSMVLYTADGRRELQKHALKYERLSLCPSLTSLAAMQVQKHLWTRKAEQMRCVAVQKLLRQLSDGPQACFETSRYADWRCFVCCSCIKRHYEGRVAYVGWWPELEGDGTLTMTKPSSSIELPILLTAFAACTYPTQC